jgi:hypothetical protein
MLKRNIFILAAGMLLSAQVAVAADQSAIPLGEEEIMQKTAPPVETTFQEQHKATNPAGCTGDAVPASADDKCGAPLPEQAKYLDEHPPVHTPGPMDGVFPKSAGD